MSQGIFQMSQESQDSVEFVGSIHEEDDFDLWLRLAEPRIPAYTHNVDTYFYNSNYSSSGENICQVAYNAFVGRHDHHSCACEPSHDHIPRSSSFDETRLERYLEKDNQNIKWEPKHETYDYFGSYESSREVYEEQPSQWPFESPSQYEEFCSTLAKGVVAVKFIYSDRSEVFLYNGKMKESIPAHLEELIREKYPFFELHRQH